MKLPVYSVRDSKSLDFGSPIISTNDYVIMRSWAQALISGRDQIQSFSPKDFDLYKIGEFDISKGVLIPISPIVHVVNAVEVINNYESEKE